LQRGGEGGRGILEIKKRRDKTSGINKTEV
jgi:hypothetical protein